MVGQELRVAVEVRRQLMSGCSIPRLRYEHLQARLLEHRDPVETGEEDLLGQIVGFHAGEDTETQSGNLVEVLLGLQAWT